VKYHGVGCLPRLKHFEAGSHEAKMLQRNRETENIDTEKQRNRETEKQRETPRTENQREPERTKKEPRKNQREPERHQREPERHRERHRETPRVSDVSTTYDDEVPIS
jgi:hypothetical protein